MPWIYRSDFENNLIMILVSYVIILVASNSTVLYYMINFSFPSNLKQIIL